MVGYRGRIRCLAVQEGYGGNRAVTNEELRDLLVGRIIVDARVARLWPGWENVIEALLLAGGTVVEFTDKKGGATVRTNREGYGGCPRCPAREVETTCMGGVILANRARCSCGWKGWAAELILKQNDVEEEAG